MLPSVNWTALTSDVLVFMPEAVLCIAIVGLLLLRLLPLFDRMHLGMVALSAVICCWVLSFLMEHFDAPAFTGMLKADSFSRFARLLILGTTALTILVSLITRIPDREDSGDFYVLLLGGTLGMLLMASANHLLMAYIAVEMASLPSYGLAGFLKGRRKGSEAALKYVVYGSGASGIMLYGISLLAGKFGTGFLPDIARAYSSVLASQGGSGSIDIILILASLFIIIGLGFKLSLVPFHFWCPDVFEGAAAEVAGFLSVASKAGAFALAGRFLLTLAPPANGDSNLLMAQYLAPILAFLAAITATFGNLAAFSQTNIKRLLAYSTIAHAGVMFAGIATLSEEGMQAVLFYLATYAFTNTGAFAIVAFLRNRTGSEEISSYRGLIYRNPWLVTAMAVFFLSLLGLPPLAGFVAKFQIFSAVYHAAQSAASSKASWLSSMFMALLIVIGLNTVLGAVYYIRVLKTMILEKPDDMVEGQTVAPLSIPWSGLTIASILAAIVLLLGVYVDPVAAASRNGARPFSKIVPAVMIPMPNQANRANPGDPPAKSKNESPKGPVAKPQSNEGGKQ